MTTMTTTTARTTARTTRRRLATLLVAATVTSLGLGTVPAAAHPHSVTTGNGRVQQLANGGNHPRFIAGESCEDYGPLPGSSIHPAWYGLETAHHGPDQGAPGKGDGCYFVAGGPLDPANDRNPAID